MTDSNLAGGYAPSLVGAVLGDRYEIREPISEGGMGRVYRATQLMLDREVAVKCIHPHLMTSESVVARFQEEAKVASRLAHPGIVEIYDFGRVPADQGGHFYIVMELLEGTDLAKELSGGRMPLPRVIDILSQVLSALGEAHDHGVTHRDVKPENIILLPRSGGGDRVKLIDFGIAKTAGTQRLTQVGTLVGSPHYMSPEQVRGETAEVSADLYAIGSVLFEALTGTLLFDDEQLMTVLQRQLAAPRPDPRAVAPERNIPAAISDVCLRAIDLDPAKRFSSAAEFAAALGAARRTSLPPASITSDSGIRETKGEGPLGPASPTRLATSTPPVSLRYRVVQRAATFSDLTRLEEQASMAMSNGDRSAALVRLMEGLSQARTLASDGEVELASAAYGSFGRRAAAMLREDGRLDESRAILEEVLEWPELSDATRAQVLEQLAMVHFDAGRTDDARSAQTRAQETLTAGTGRRRAARGQSARPALESSSRIANDARAKQSTFRGRRPMVVEESVAESKKSRIR